MKKQPDIDGFTIQHLPKDNYPDKSENILNIIKVLQK